MASSAIVQDSMAVVFKGHFLPSIFSPAWLLGKKLIGAADYEAAEVEVVSRDLAAFRCGWLRCTVTSDALQVATSDPTEFERLRDIAIGVLQSLPESPIGVMGINRDVHFAVDSQEQWHTIGDLLAPKDIWLDSLVLPGLRSLSVLGVRPDLHAGYVQVRVEPSLAVPQAVFVAHNDHFALADVEAQPEDRSGVAVWGSSELEAGDVSQEKVPAAIDILASEWTDSFQRSQRVFDSVQRLGRIS